MNQACQTFRPPFPARPRRIARTGLFRRGAVVFFVLVATPALVSGAARDTVRVPPEGLLDPTAFAPLDAVWAGALGDTALVRGDALTSQVSREVSGPLAQAAETLTAGEVCAGRATPVQVRQVLYGLVMDALAPVSPPPEVRLDVDLALREILPRAVPDTLGCRSLSAGPAVPSRTVTVGPFVLTEEEIARISGDRTDRQAMIDRLMDALPARAEPPSRETLLSLVPAVVAPARPPWEPPPDAVDAFFKAMVEHEEEGCQ